MAVNTTTTKRQFAGDGATSVFPVTAYKIYASSEILVQIKNTSDATVAGIAAGDTITLTLTTDYTVALSGSATGVAYTFTVTIINATYTSLPVGLTLIIRRVLPQTQLTTLANGTPTPANTYQQLFDRAIMIIQQLQEIIDRAVIQDIDATTNVTFPSPEERRALVWEGDQLVNSENDPDAAGDAADDAAASAAAALVSETAAAASATAAALEAGKLSGTSTTSLAIAVASKTFTTQAGKSFAVGAFLLITSDADPTNYMHGQVTSYSGTTLIVNVTNVGGSGTHADWTIRVSGTRGATGATGPAGSSPLTTQGDVFYRDNSGDQRLPAGTAGQLLMTGGAGANPSWVDSLRKVDSGTVTAQSSFSITGLSPGKRYKLKLNLVQNTSTGVVYAQFNSDTGANYGFNTGSYIGGDTNTGQTRIPIGYSNSDAIAVGNPMLIELDFETKPSDSTFVLMLIQNLASYDSSLARAHIGGGTYDGASNLASIQIGTSGGTVTGTWALYETL